MPVPVEAANPTMANHLSKVVEKVSSPLIDWAPLIILFFVAVLIFLIKDKVANLYAGIDIYFGKDYSEWDMIFYQGDWWLLRKIGWFDTYLMELEIVKTDKKTTYIIVGNELPISNSKFRSLRLKKKKWGPAC